MAKIIFIKTHPVGIAEGHIVNNATQQQISEFVDGGYAKLHSEVSETKDEKFTNKKIKTK